MIQILLNNDYPLSFIFSNTLTRIKYHYNRSVNHTHRNKNIKIKNRFFSIPYVKTISELFFPVAVGINKKIAFTIANTLKKYITRGKNKLDHMSHQKVV